MISTLLSGGATHSLTSRGPTTVPMGIDFEGLSSAGFDQTWKSPCLVLTDMAGAISLADFGRTRRSETTVKLSDHRLVTIMLTCGDRGNNWFKPCVSWA